MCSGQSSAPTATAADTHQQPTPADVGKDLTMATVRHEIVIEAQAAQAWAVVTDAANLHTWFPGLTACTLDGDLRTITLGSGMPMPERIITNDSIQMRFQYRIESPLFREHLGTIDVIALSARTCLVVYSTDAEPGPLALVIGGASNDALANLKAMCEGGADEAPRTSMHTTPRES